MCMSSLLRLLPLLGFFLVASNAQAVSYQWVVNAQPSYKYGSASSACSAYTARRNETAIASNSGYRWSMDGVSAASSPTQFNCNQTRTNIHNPSYISKESSLGSRTGDSCPPGAILTNELECVIPPDACAPLAGQTTNFFALTPPGSSSLPGEYVCFSGCRASWSGECGANAEGQSACWGLATYTGVSCVTGDSPAGPPPPPDQPPSQCPTGYSWSGTTCVPTNPPDPDPEPCEGPDCPPDPDDPPDPDPEPCEGPDCPPEPCEGPDCPPDTGGGPGPGSGDDGDDGDDDGSDGSDGGSDTGKDDSGQPCRPSIDANCAPCEPSIDPTCASAVTGVDDCAAQLQCNGDAIQCAILRTQKRQACQLRWDAQVQADVQAAVSGPQFELQDKTIPVASLFNDAISKGRWLSASCPPPRTVTVLGKSQQLSFQPICEFAIALGPLLVAFASIAFALIIGKGLKGN